MLAIEGEWSLFDFEILKIEDDDYKSGMTAAIPRGSITELYRE